jgi:muramoyltetrapeptide carboxypeptidase
MPIGNDTGMETAIPGWRVVKPRPLSEGDRVSLIAPAGSTTEADRVQRSVTALEALGLEVKASLVCGDMYGYLAGKDKTRVHELEAAFADPGTKGVFCLKGGFGSARILDKIDYSIIEANPKVFVGYSDITALHLAFGQRCGLVTFHGPMPSSDMLPVFEPASRESLEHAVFSRNGGELPQILNPSGRPLVRLSPGVAEGRLVGGNLSLLAASMGTPWEIDTRGKIVFIEDIDEAPYRIDRMLNQLRLAGKFDSCAGIVIGAWTNCVAGEGKRSLSIEEVIADEILPSGKPVLSGLQAGHCSPTLTLPLGIRYRLDANHGTLEPLEPPTLPWVKGCPRE